ncbi:hypothetical protein DFH27DRAFT_607984 [Peziza echinospora]|nr:hypothetical protein DFH27DRAFT_607984 [Peziza echinospora]
MSFGDQSYVHAWNADGDVVDDGTMQNLDTLDDFTYASFASTEAQEGAGQIWRDTDFAGDFVLYDAGSSDMPQLSHSSSYATLPDVDTSPAMYSAGFFEQFVTIGFFSTTEPAPALSQPYTPTPSPRSTSQEFRCSDCGKKYQTKNNLQRHRRSAAHSPLASTLLAFRSPSDSPQMNPMIAIIDPSIKVLHDCPHPDCLRKGDQGFVRKDNMIQHQRLVHGTKIDKRDRTPKNKGEIKKRRSS